MTTRQFPFAAYLVTACALVVSWALNLAAQSPPTRGQKTDASDSTSPADLPDKLEPATPRTEAEDDKLTAATHYSQSRLLQQRGEHLLALRHLQRAWRYDPETDFLLAEIVPLAFEAKQSDAAARYAVLAAERDPKDPLLTRRLAIYLTEKKDYARALRMYEKSLVKDAQLKDGMPEDVGAATLYAELGRLYYLAEQYDKSAQAFLAVRRAIEDKASPLDENGKETLLGEPATTYTLWGESFLEAGEFDAAKHAFEQANAKKEDRPLLALRLARVAAAQKQTGVALERLEEHFAAKTTEQGSEPYQLLAKLLAEQNREPAVAQQKLIAKLRELHAAQPDNQPVGLALANALWTVGNLAEAVPLLTKALAKQPDSDGYQKLIEHHWRQKEFRDLLAAAGQLAERTGSLDALGDLLPRLQKDQVAMLACRKIAEEQAAVTDPKPAHAPILAAAVLLRGAGQVKEAEALFRSVLALDPPKKLELRPQWALGLFFDDQHEPAATMFRQVLAQQPPPANPAAIRYYLAGALEMSGRTDDALGEIDLAVQAQPGNPRFESRRGWVLYHAKRWNEAREEYERFLAKYGSRQQPELRDLLRSSKLALSNVALELDDFPRAVEWLEQVLDEYPEDAGALNDLGYLWADRNQRLQRALRMTQQAVEQEPKNKAYRDSLGWAFHRLGRYDEAARELAIAVEDDDPHGVLLDHYADVLAKQGKAAEARAYWQRAVEAFQKEGDTEKAKHVREKLGS